jgi:hypothetical protein
MYNVGCFLVHSSLSFKVLSVQLKRSPFISVTDVKHARRVTSVYTIRRPNLGTGTEWSCETNLCGRRVNCGSVDSTSEVRRLPVGIIHVMGVKRR